MNVTTEQIVIQAVSRWLNEVVIGLNLCPFSAKPAHEKRIRFLVSQAQNDEDLLQTLQHELELLNNKQASEIETTLVIVANHLQDFFEYKQFLTWSAQLLKRNGWTGVFQLASFHPDYCFTNAAPEDVENLTNRAPYPILHILREDSLEKALEYFPDAYAIPDNNKQRVENLTSEEKITLFPYIFCKNK